MPDGGVQYHYDGIQVRKVPLPLRVPPSAQSQSPQPQILKTLPNAKQPQNNNIQPQQPSQQVSQTHRSHQGGPRGPPPLRSEFLVTPPLGKSFCNFTP